MNSHKPMTTSNNAQTRWGFTIAFTAAVVALAACSEPRVAETKPSVAPTAGKPEHNKRQSPSVAPAEQKVKLAMNGSKGSELAHIVSSVASKPEHAPGSKAGDSPVGDRPSLASAADEPGCDTSASITGTALTFARAVEAREPVDAGNTFEADEGRVFAHLRLDSNEDNREIVAVFKHYDREYYRAPLRVGKSPRWRTWASIRATPKNAGSWTVDIQDEDGKLLASRSFTIEGDVLSPSEPVDETTRE